MRILFFSTAFPQPFEPSRNPDNLERCVALARDHDVQVISPLTWRHVAADKREVSSTERGLAVARPVFFYPPGILRGVHAWCMWHGIRRTASRIVDRFRPDVVVGYWTYPDAAVAAKVARLAGVPCVGIVGGSDVLSIDPAAPGRAGRRVQQVLQSLDSLAAVSDSIKDHITALGTAPDKVHVLPSAVDRSVFCPGSREAARRRLGIPPSAQVLVWVGRMVPVKELDALIDAVRALDGRIPDVRLYLVGDGPLRRSLEAKAAATGAGKVIFTGRVAHRDLPDYYRAANVTVLPSAWEGMPNALLESHACGTPFVASAVGAIPQLAQPHQDEVVAPGDSHGFADAIARCLSRTGEDRAPVASRAAGWEEMADAISELLAATCQSRRITAVAGAAPAPVRMPRHQPRLRSWRAS